uniref:Uncharacterized protein n=1 Tax=Physcomitrium patens TaxID=3218 RepID=A0A2K1JVP4_PHYPA|nr:hypothetical protein PHYPA_015372 [Physcomitrium patens]
MACLSLALFAPQSPISVWAPLTFVLVLGLMREEWVHRRPAKDDCELNNLDIAEHDSNGAVEVKKWKALCVEGPRQSKRH